MAAGDVNNRSNIEAAWSAVEHTVVEPLAPRRRAGLKWKAFEVEALKRGVRQCGVGNWQSILEMFEDVFGRRRSVVDLKDKWRNMARRRCGVGTGLRWEACEVEALKTGVRRCGVGRWQSILVMFEDVFGRRRSVVDLKDKWRNMVGR